MSFAKRCAHAVLAAVALAAAASADAQTLTLAEALRRAEARSPTITAAEASLEAARARARQAGLRTNPELSVELENFAGSGELSGFRSTETTVSVNQRLDLGGRRGARMGAARAELAAAELRLAIARADLAQQVRERFARALAAQERVRLAEENEARARELARVAGLLVETGREPPLRALRARSAAAQAAAELDAARAAERAERTTLASLFGESMPVDGVSGPFAEPAPEAVDPERSLDVRLADAELGIAEAMVGQERANGRVDPSVGLGVRHVRETGDVGLVGGVTIPLQIFDRNQGNIDAARADVRAAEARRASALATVTVRAGNAAANVEAARARVAALEGAAIPEAAEALRLAERSYQIGRASLVELIDVQTAHTNAQAALVEAQLALALAIAELSRVAAQ